MGFFSSSNSNKKTSASKKIRTTVVKTQNVAKELLSIAESNGVSIESLDFNILEIQQELTANFTAGQTTVSMGGNVQFYNTSTGNPDSFQWSFEGGSPATSTLENPLVTYNSYGTFTVSLTVSSGATTSTLTLEDFITVLPETQSILIPSGWSGISGYLIPDNADPDVLFQDIINDIIILKSADGVFYPQYGINTIGEWDTFEGYCIKTENETVLQINGAMPLSKDISLVAGWNSIPVLSKNNVSVEELFSDIQPQLIIVKEIAGKRCIGRQ